MPFYPIPGGAPMASAWQRCSISIAGRSTLCAAGEDGGPGVAPIIQLFIPLACILFLAHLCFNKQGGPRSVPRGVRSDLSGGHAKDPHRDPHRAEVERLINGAAFHYALLLMQFQHTAPQIYWPHRLYRQTVRWIRRWVWR